MKLINIPQFTTNITHNFSFIDYLMQLFSRIKVDLDHNFKYVNTFIA